MSEHAHRPKPSNQRRHRWRIAPRKPRPSEWILGLLVSILGVGGGLAYSWLLAPVTDVLSEPHQLHYHARSEYMVAILLRWAADGDDLAAWRDLAALQLGEDIAAAVAERACDLVGRGFTNSNSGFRTLQKVIHFYQNAGKEGCADFLAPPATAPALVLITAVPQEPQPTNTPSGTALPGPPDPTRSFQLTRLETHCDPATAGLITIYVQEPNAQGIPGQIVRVSGPGKSQSDFLTGLHPNRDAGYADFAMKLGETYRVELPGQAPPSAALLARSCQTRGQTIQRSYLLIYRPAK